ncbi:MAG: (2Fe-2S) ferredoxin domain-containing protein [Rhodospirillales bacterium]
MSLPPPDSGTTDPRPKRLLVCVNMRFQSDRGSCAMRGGRQLLEALRASVAERRINVRVEEIVCLGQCGNGPAMRLAPGGDFFLKVKDGDLEDILAKLEVHCGLLDAGGDGDDGGETGPDNNGPPLPPLHLLGS